MVIHATTKGPDYSHSSESSCICTFLHKPQIYISIYGTGSEKMSYRYIFIKVIKMIHFKIATSPEP